MWQWPYLRFSKQAIYALQTAQRINTKTLCYQMELHEVSKINHNEATWGLPTFNSLAYIRLVVFPNNSFGNSIILHAQFI